MIPAPEREVEDNSKVIGRKGQDEYRNLGGPLLLASTCFQHKEEITNKKLREDITLGQFFMSLKDQKTRNV